MRSTEPSLACNESRIAVTLVDFHLASKRHSTAELRQVQYRAVSRQVATRVHRRKGLLFVIMGNAELVASNPQLESGVRELGARTFTATEDASSIVRTLAETLKQLS